MDNIILDISINEHSIIHFTSNVSGKNRLLDQQQ